MPKFCTECGSKLSPGMKFCSECGTKIPVSTAPAAPPAPPAPKPTLKAPVAKSPRSHKKNSVLDRMKKFESESESGGSRSPSARSSLRSNSARSSRACSLDNKEKTTVPAWKAKLKTKKQNSPRSSAANSPRSSAAPSPPSWKANLKKKKQQQNAASPTSKEPSTAPSPPSWKANLKKTKQQQTSAPPTPPFRANRKSTAKPAAEATPALPPPKKKTIVKPAAEVAPAPPPPRRKNSNPAAPSPPADPSLPKYNRTPTQERLNRSPAPAAAPAPPPPPPLPKYGANQKSRSLSRGSNAPAPPSLPSRRRHLSPRRSASTSRAVTPPPPMPQRHSTAASMPRQRSKTPTGSSSSNTAAVSNPFSMGGGGDKKKKAAEPPKEDLYSCLVCAFKNTKRKNVPMTKQECTACGCIQDENIINPPKPKTPAAPQGDGKEKSRAERHASNRKKLLEEIVNTEIQYVKSLSILFLDFMLPLANGSTIVPPSLQRLADRARVKLFFAHTRRLLDVNRKFLQELQSRKKRKATIGEVFADFAPLFSIYGKYAESHERVSMLLRETLEKKGPQAWLKTIVERFPRWKSVPQQSPFFILIKPVQRVPRYRLLIQELAKYTPETDPSRDQLLHALEIVKSIAAQVNETIRQAENQEKLHALQRNWDDPDSVDLLEGDSGDRQLKKEGPLARHTRKGSKVKKYYFHLFNDMVLYSESLIMGKVGGSSYKLHFRTFLNRACMVRDVPFHPKEDEEMKFLFSIETPKKSFVVEAESEKDKQEWIVAIQASIDMAAEKARLKGIDEKDDLDAYVAPVWTKDHAGAKCELCSKGFNLITRRHHCRNCGKLVCSSCSPHRLLIPGISKSKKQRVCNECKPKIESGSFGSRRSSGSTPDQSVRGNLDPSLLTSKTDNSASSGHSSAYTQMSTGSGSWMAQSMAMSGSIEESAETRIFKISTPQKDAKRFNAVRKFLRKQVAYCKQMRDFNQALVKPFLNRIYMKESGSAIHEGQNVPLTICLVLESIHPIYALQRKLKSDIIKALDSQVWSSSISIAHQMQRLSALCDGFYRAYAGSLPVAKRLLNEKKDSMLARYQEALKQTGHSLDHHMEASMTHLTMCGLSFHEIVRNTSQNHPDKKKMEDIAERFQQASDRLFKLKEEAERVDYLVRLESSMKAKTGEPLGLVSTSRYLIREGSLIRQTRRGKTHYHFHLFNDILLYSSNDITSGGYVVHRRIMLKDVTIQPTNEQFCLQINSPQKSFIICAENEANFVAWKVDLEQQVKMCEAESGGKKALAAALWVQDKEVDACPYCKDKFTLFNRRHHCRQCGNLCCGKCSTHKDILPNIDRYKPQRICDRCYVQKFG